MKDWDLTSITDFGVDFSDQEDSEEIEEEDFEED